MFLTGNFNSCNSRLCEQRLFICNLSQKIKSHVVESQITLLVWTCLSLTEKQHTIIHIIIFNDSISKFYQRSIRGFCRDISMFFSNCLCKKKKKKKIQKKIQKKNAQASKFLGILKKYVSENKIYFCLKRKAMFCLIKSFFCLSHNFET